MANDPGSNRPGPNHPGPSFHLTSSTGQQKVLNLSGMSVPSVLLSQLTRGDGRLQPEGRSSPGQMLLEVSRPNPSGLAREGQRVLTVPQAPGLRLSPVPHQTAFSSHIQPHSVPIFRGSGLVSLTPATASATATTAAPHAHRTSPLPRRHLQIPRGNPTPPPPAYATATASASVSASAYAQVPVVTSSQHGNAVMLRVPSPARSPANAGRVVRTPSPKPARSTPNIVVVRRTPPPPPPPPPPLPPPLHAAVSRHVSAPQREALVAALSAAVAGGGALEASLERIPSRPGSRGTPNSVGSSGGGSMRGRSRSPHVVPALQPPHPGDKQTDVVFERLPGRATPGGGGPRQVTSQNARKGYLYVHNAPPQSEAAGAPPQAKPSSQALAQLLQMRVPSFTANQSSTDLVKVEKVEPPQQQQQQQQQHLGTPPQTSVTSSVTSSIRYQQPLLHRQLTRPFKATERADAAPTQISPNGSPSVPAASRQVASTLPYNSPEVPNPGIFSHASVAARLTALEMNNMDRTNSEAGMPQLIPEAAIPFGGNPDVKDVKLTDFLVKKEDGSDDEDTVEIKNPFSLRVVNLSNFPNNQNSYRSSYRSHSQAVGRATAGSITNTARSLDLLRQNLQKFINKDIDAIIQKYVQEFFRPGIENIRLNNGDMAVTDDHVQAVCSQVLEEAKKMYVTTRRSCTPDINDNVSDPGNLPESKVVRDRKISLFHIKKRRGSSDSEASVSKKRVRKPGRPPLHLQGATGRSTPSKTSKSEVKKEGPKWDPERLKEDTLFVMGARANKALGLGAQRGRLYIKHPDLFKYCGDQDDKNWLYENHHMPATGGKAYLLLVADIMELAETEEYKGNPGLMLHEVVGFSVPESMLEKMRSQMMTMRTDLPKPGKTVKPRAPTPSSPQPPAEENTDKLPFSNLSDKPSSSSLTDSKSDTQASPGAPDPLDLLATDHDDDDPPSVSPLNMAGGFGADDASGTPDVSPAPSDLDAMEEEMEPVRVPFKLE